MQMAHMSPSGRGRPRLLSRLCCVTSGHSLILIGFSFIMMRGWRKRFPIVGMCGWEEETQCPPHQEGWREGVREAARPPRGGPDDPEGADEPGGHSTWYPGKGQGWARPWKKGRQGGASRAASEISCPISRGPAAVLLHRTHFLPPEHSLWGGDRYPERPWPW